LIKINYRAATTPEQSSIRLTSHADSWPGKASVKKTLSLFELTEVKANWITVPGGSFQFGRADRKSQWRPVLI